MAAPERISHADARIGERAAGVDGSPAEHFLRVCHSMVPQPWDTPARQNTDPIGPNRAKTRGLAPVRPQQRKRPMLTRRRVLASSAALAAAGLAPAARAQVLKRPAQIIVGFPAGG